MLAVVATKDAKQTAHDTDLLSPEEAKYYRKLHDYITIDGPVRTLQYKICRSNGLHFKTAVSNASGVLTSILKPVEFIFRNH